MNRLLLTLLQELQDRVAAFADGVERETKLPPIPNKIMVTIGMRRTGKTYFLLQHIEKLLKENVALTRILYANFEDTRLHPLTFENLSALLDGFYSLYPENHDQLCYLFLDEIQNIENWEAVIRRYFDTKKVKIYLTGSSAKLLSKEIATSLRGRSIATEIWPFSFTEFLTAKKIRLPEIYGQKSLDKLTHWLKIYLKQGGFPETLEFEREMENKLIEIWRKVLGTQNINNNSNFFDLGGHSLSAIEIIVAINKQLGANIDLKNMLEAQTINQLNNMLGIAEENRRRILQDYLSAVIFRDIVERYKVSNIELIRYMINFMLKNVGCSFSVNKFYNDLRSQGHTIGRVTVYNYLNYIEDAYLAFTVSLYSESFRKEHTNPRKIYAVDTGLVSACTFGFAENTGHHFENLIYLDLRRANHKIYYYLTKTRKEVDFLTQDLLGKWHLFQVCWDTTDAQTLERETTALQEAEEELKITGECVTPSNYFTSFLPKIQKRNSL
jgi:predicted AAA+ superfamily ATPase